jgi:glycerophosphoryl diester phosphodiesterase
MTLTSDETKLMPLLELALMGSVSKTLLVHGFDLASAKNTGNRHLYKLARCSRNIGDFITSAASAAMRFRKARRMH